MEATVAASPSIGRVTGEGPRSLVEPALYAFFVWGPIFALSIAYAVYQALPAQRENPLLRRIGAFTAEAFLCTGLWSVVVPMRQLSLALAMLLGIFACLLVAYLRLSRPAYGGVRTRSFGAAEPWLVALPVGLFLGWITAAIAVSLVSQAVGLGVIQGRGPAEALLGGVTLVMGGVVAALVVRAGRQGPWQGYMVYGATVPWALVGILVNQYQSSSLITGAALAAAFIIALTLLQRGSH